MLVLTPDELKELGKYNMWLTPDQLVALTHYKRPSGQMAQLDDWGWEYHTNTDGAVFLSREEIHRHLGTGVRLTRLYLIRFEGAPRYLKIGISDDPEKRLKALQTGCPVPLTLLGDTLGCIEKERYLHRKYKHLRAQGEWFKDRGPIYQEFGIRKA